jgi:hypothetical protein
MLDAEFGPALRVNGGKSVLILQPEEAAALVVR